MSSTNKATNVSPQPPASQVREIFAAKYDALLQWALQLTHGDRERAEDLLHESFVHFALRQLDLTRIENIDGYFYVLLKHFYRSAQRRAKRDPLNQISLVEFDSVDLALRSTFDFDQVDVQNSLRRVCTFLCWRKASTKSASYLILRFFHGYYPEEIMRIALVSRRSVYEGTRLASAEAKVCLADPGRLHFMPAPAKDKTRDGATPGVPESVPQAAPALFAVPPAEFLHVLSEIIISSRVDACLPKEELLRLYEQDAARQTETIDLALLAHLVSCTLCLDTVNRYLQMPPLSDRFPGDKLGNDRRNYRKGGGAVHRTPKGTGPQMRNEQQAYQEMREAKDSILKVAEARLRECFEHQPRKLFVAVNGETVASQDVTSEHNKQSVRVPHRKTVEFVEVFSEQGIRLAFISVMLAPPEGPATLSQRVELSDGRSLQAVLEFTANGPLLEVVYYDPLMAHFVAALEAEPEQSLVMIPGFDPAAEAVSEIDRRERQPFLIRLAMRLTEWMDAYRPLVISGAIAVIFAIVAGIYLGRLQSNAQQARTLLASAAQQEHQPIGAGHIVHRVLEFEVAAQGDAKPMERGTVTVWKSADEKRLAMRFSSTDGKLLGGIWKATDGSYSVYQGHKLTDHSTAPDALRGAVTSEDAASLWMDEPTASSFPALATNQGIVTVQRSGDESVVTYEPEPRVPKANQPHLVRASLTLRADHHVVGQTFWIESGGEVRSYRYREVSYEEREGAASDGNVFSPDRNLTGSHASLRHGMKAALPDNAVFLAHLNLEAFSLLNSVNADSGERINVKRTPSQHLRISGILPSDERLAQVKAALAPLSSNPLVDISLASAEQQSQQVIPSGRHKTAPPAITAENFEINARAIPAQDRLKAYFSRRGHSGKDLDRQIDTFCQDALGHSSHALQQAWTLHTLASSFSLRDWQHMAVNDRQQWIALYLRHSTALHGETQAIHQSLDVLAVNASGDSSATSPNLAEDAQAVPPSQVSLNTLSDQLLEQSSVADRVLRSALTASAGQPPDLDALCKKLQDSLASTDRAIREIERRAQDLETTQPMH